jgi:hypothetical protein
MVQTAQHRLKCRVTEPEYAAAFQPFSAWTCVNDSDFIAGNPGRHSALLPAEASTSLVLFGTFGHRHHRCDRIYQGLYRDTRGTLRRRLAEFVTQFDCFTGPDRYL